MARATEEKQYSELRVHLPVNTNQSTIGSTIRNWIATWMYHLNRFIGRGLPSLKLISDNANRPNKLGLSEVIYVSSSLWWKIIFCAIVRNFHLTTTSLISSKKFILARHFKGSPQLEDIELVQEELPAVQNGGEEAVLIRDSTILQVSTYLQYSFDLFSLRGTLSSIVS